MKHAHAMSFGATLLPDGGSRFRLWAPSCPRVELEWATVEPWSRRGMQATGDGWHELYVAAAGAGTRYRFVVTGNASAPLAVPDPASRANPDGVHQASMVVDPRAYRWNDDQWRGRPWTEAVIYELHVGCFTPEGTYAALQRRLPELAALGITAIELMPLAAFPGARNWGYDGVLPFAPAACYGTPDELKALVDAAHGLGLMVLLDVVYNHLGPEGNYLHAYCPEFFNPEHRTPWGAAINFDGNLNESVREFFIHNALYWVEEYRFDGLRLDAIHAIRDDSMPPIVCEIARALREGPGKLREVHLVLENDGNEVAYLQRDGRQQAILADAQWNDDLHHALHVLITHETDGYYEDYAAEPLHQLGRAMAEGFAYQGDFSHFRHAPRGEKSTALHPASFIGFLQNHDQIGNRAFGERISAIADPALLAAACACLLLSPQTPMLFMGEEYAASSPFLFFCDFGPELAPLVAAGRRDEFKRFAAFADARQRARIPDPNAESTFQASKLHWEERELSPHREHLAFVARLLDLRHRHLTPRLAGKMQAGRHSVDGRVLRVHWQLADASHWYLLAHFGNREVEIGAGRTGKPIYSCRVQETGAARMRLQPGAVIVTHEPAGN